ncbi:MAG: folate-binding protein YgfZ [Deltaproteobacteria bacterium]|nr:folate-binding protein YgfZ [Deltaproteobacteria bacterium]
MAGQFLTNDVVLQVVGDKAAKFLHGQLSNSITTLQVGQGNQNALLSQKGKVQGLCFALHTVAGFLLLTDPASEPALTGHLKKLAPLSRCRLNHSDKAVIYLGAFSDHDAFQLNLGDSQHWQESSHSALLFRSDRYGERGYDLVIETQDYDFWQDTLSQKNFVELSEEQIETTRIQNTVPRFGEDVTTDHLPQEARLDRVLHFDKGCYLGQEVIARLHYRGHANKFLTSLRSESPVQIGDALCSDDKEISVVTSVVDLNGAFCFLSYVPHKVLENKGALMVNGEKVVLVKN